MKLVCLDMEGVLLPEMWVAFADASGIPELRITTREEPDYNKLMRYRIEVLREHGMGLPQIQEVTREVEPIPGAREFLDELRTFAQVIVISDTFIQFIQSILYKLGYPTVFCNELVVDETGAVVDYKMRCNPSKLTTVKALQTCGMETIASGDSFNDLGMIEASEAGFFFRTTDAIKAQYPEIPAYEEFDELLAAIKAAL